MFVQIETAARGTSMAYPWRAFRRRHPACLTWSLVLSLFVVITIHLVSDHTAYETLAAKDCPCLNKVTVKDEKPQDNYLVMGSIGGAVREDKPVDVAPPADSKGSDVAAPSGVRLCTQVERLRHVQRVCARIRPTLGAEFLEPAQRTLADDHHKILYCWMSKVGCTSFKTLFLRAAGFTGKLTMMNVHRIQFLKSQGLPLFFTLNETEEAPRLKNYFKFLNVRHPFERLISVYRDKILSPGTDFPKWILTLNKLYHPEVFSDPLMNLSAVGVGAASRRARERYPPSFADFAQWLAEKNIFANDHWRTVQWSCHPCALDWDAILRIETMNHDSSILLDRLGKDLEHASQIPVVHSHQNASHGTTVYAHTSKVLGQYANVSAEAVEKYLRYYKTDMEMFGYTWNQRTLTASCGITTEDGGLCC